MIPGLILIFTLPLFVFSLINLPLRNILIQSLTGIPFDDWIYTGMIFIVAAFGLFPLIYRDFFNLRIHRKLLTNIALAPYSKQMMIAGYLCVATLEALTMGMIAMVIYTFIIPFPLTVIQLVSMIFYFVIFILILGNLFITLSLAVNSPTTYMMFTFLIFLLVIFGSGLIIEFGFFPMTFEKVLIWLPLAIPIRAMHFFMISGIIDWTLTAISIAICIFWSIANGIYLKEKLCQ